MWQRRQAAPSYPRRAERKTETADNRDAHRSSSRGKGKCKCMQVPCGVALVASQHDVTTVVIQTVIHATHYCKFSNNPTAPTCNRDRSRFQQFFSQHLLTRMFFFLQMRWRKSAKMRGLFCFRSVLP